MKRKFGVAPILHCSKGGGKEFLSEVFMCVNKDFKVVDCGEVCVQHDCTPSPSEDQHDFCGKKLIFKVPDDDMQLATAAADDECKLCKPKSGTCKPGGGHGSTLQ